jgi:hypothetical protein
MEGDGFHIVASFVTLWTLVPDYSPMGKDDISKEGQKGFESKSKD